jgi:hypothetical protein
LQELPERGNFAKNTSTETSYNEGLPVSTDEGNNPFFPTKGYNYSNRKVRRSVRVRGWGPARII